MNKYLILITVLLSGCNFEIEHEIDEVQVEEIQITVRYCIDGFQWSDTGDAIVDEFGAQMACEVPHG